MKFLQSLFRFDANASAAEKALTVLGSLFALVLFVILFGSALGIFHNNISRAAATATGTQKTIGILLLVGAGFWAWLNWSDRVPFKINETAATLLIVLLLVFSMLFLTGFYANVF